MMTRTEKLNVARRTAADGLVLLKNDCDVLPLARESEIALMGVTSYCCHRMGWGSGDMLAQTPVSYDRGLANAGIRLFQPVANFYRSVMLEKKEAFENTNRHWWKWTPRYPEPFMKDEDFAKMVEGHRGMPCVVTIGRGAGESTDLAAGPGSHYLHWEEDFLLKLACANFDNVIVLLNVCGAIDTSWLDKYPVKAVLITSLLGEASGDAVADVLTGRVNPSGRLTTTWAKRYCDYPTTDCFGTMEVPYHEGIFVGYRYFDTFGVEPRFPFGFGMSYTTFSVKAGAASAKGSSVKLSATVKNTGKAAGAQVVQAYVSMPDGEMEKAYQDLCAFARTPTLEPGESAKVDLSFDLADFASYSEKRAAFVLEKGDYIVRVGDSSRSTRVACALRLARTAVTEKAANRFADADFSALRLISKKGATPFSYGGEKDEIASAKAKATAINADAIKTLERRDAAAAKPRELPAPKAGARIVTLNDVRKGKATLEQLVAQFSNEELARCINGVDLNDPGAVSSGADAVTGVGGANCGAVRGEAGELWQCGKYGIPMTNCADGPSGIRLSIFGDDPGKDSEMARLVVAYPCGTALAQSWSEDAAVALGRSVCSDMELARIDGWLAPGLNIHRNPLCGRNFEYFSEDPLVSGRIAAAICRGVQTRADGASSGRYCTMKHFAANNQEFERGVQNNIVAERALREIYLRGFRFAVSLGRPHALMTCYNRLNGDWCAVERELLNGILRGEWGWEGCIMTDWWNAADCRKHAFAGNDLIMPGAASRIETIKKALDDGEIDRASVQECAVRIVRMIEICASAQNR